MGVNSIVAGKNDCNFFKKKTIVCLQMKKKIQIFLKNVTTKKIDNKTTSHNGSNPEWTKTFFSKYKDIRYTFTK